MSTVRAFVLIQAKGNHRNDIHHSINTMGGKEGSLFQPKGIIKVTRTQGTYDLHVEIECASEDAFTETTDMIKAIDGIEHVCVDRVIYNP